jgi:hypothetical protein
MPGISLGNPEDLRSTSALREYCENGRTLIRPLYNELHIAADELEAMLRLVPSNDPSFGGLDSRVRAKIVAGHLRRSGDAAEAAVVSLVKCFMSYRKHFLIPPAAANRPVFDING